MADALYIAATGMIAHQKEIDTIANNMANLKTVAFKRGRVNFEDLVQRQMGVSSVSPPSTEATSWPYTLGQGVQVRQVDRVFEPGELHQTANPMDIAIKTDGFIEVSLTDGSHAYIRGARLKVNTEGWLSTETGLVLRPGIRIPSNAQHLQIAENGLVTYTLAGRHQPIDAGQLELVRFSNNTGLQAVGGGAYKATEASGEPIAARTGDPKAVLIAQGVIEQSNVKLVDEMVALTLSQRAFEANSKVIQASDQMLEMINNLRRS